MTVMRKTNSHYYTSHLAFQWRWEPYQRDVFLDGGSVEWRFGPLILEKRYHSRY